ncbi:hypothetical protein F5B21DRAFT_201769 [Xylaria acuta]|nr:hypothetical protein F5B21DRAFT_201769 [Xylaria acuta]
MFLHHLHMQVVEGLTGSSLFVVHLCLPTYLLAAEEVTTRGQEIMSSSFLSRLFTRVMLIRMDNAVRMYTHGIKSATRHTLSCSASPVLDLVWSPLSCLNESKCLAVPITLAP